MGPAATFSLGVASNVMTAAAARMALNGLLLGFMAWVSWLFPFAAARATSVA
jgi:hypothetical protein